MSYKVIGGVSMTCSAATLIRSSRLAALVLPVLFAACDSLGPGGCEHRFLDPLFELRSVTDSAQGTPVSVVLLTDFAVDGRAIPASHAAITPPSTRAAVQGDTVACSVTCGFGNLEGAWRFTAVAPGFRATQVQTTGKYPNFDGGCPSTNSGSVVISIRLQR